MSTRETKVDVKPRSRDVTDGMQKAPARAMLRAIGMTDDDWQKPQVAVASAWNEVTPCNMTLRKLAEHVKDGVRATGGFLPAAAAMGPMSGQPWTSDLATKRA